MLETPERVRRLRTDQKYFHEEPAVTRTKVNTLSFTRPDKFRWRHFATNQSPLKTGRELRGNPLALAIQTLNERRFRPKLHSMGKSKNPATGDGYLGELMVHRISRAIGTVENVTEAKTGWPPQITVKLADGSFKKGRLSDFREPSNAERESYSAG
jgi:hypothetical protein